ncbi:MAG TPA: cation diffusion facilitator family transporter [Burkholderiales bacterium]|nr:cation diffusion facilitator family transporter [Burkholderiales bacterium]
MGHAHHHHTHDHSRAFGIGIALNIIFVCVEFLFGVSSHSLALLADAGHNFSDVLALAVAWGAAILSKRIPSERYTYGFRSSSILAGLFNAILLLVVTGGIMWASLSRLSHPESVNGRVVTAVALFGFLVNLATALLLRPGHDRDLNVRAAFFHMAADAAVSLGVALSGIVILYTGWERLDPGVSLVISAVIVYGTWDLLRDSMGLALNAVPENIDPAGVKGYFSALSGVSEVHDLHIWGMSTTESALTVHLVMTQGHPGDAWMAKVSEDLHDLFHIEHATMQIERGDPDYPCILAPEHRV